MQQAPSIASAAPLDPAAVAADGAGASSAVGLGEGVVGGEAAGGGGAVVEGRGGWRRLASDPATILVLVALLVGVGYWLLLVNDYRRMFVQPDNNLFILKEGLRDGLAFTWRDFPNSLQLRAPDEFRPRFLTYYLLEIDQKLRLMLYDWMPPHPTFMPFAWLFYLAVGPYYLYRLLRNMTGNRLAGLAAVAVFISGTGFLSAFSMQFMPGKPLSNTVLILTLYAASEAVKRLEPGQLFVQAPGPQKYLALLWIVVGLFLDEMPIAILAILPLVYWPYFFPRWPWKLPQAVSFVKNGLFLSVPALAFLWIVVFVVPPLTEYFFDYTFDYLGDILLIHGNTRTAPSLEVALQGGANSNVIGGNLTTLFGLSLVPRQVTPLLYTLNGLYPSGQEMNLPKVVVLVLFFAAAVFIAVKSRGAVAVHLRGMLLALPPFIVFLSLLMARHIPVVTGYYYGAIFASIFALTIGLMVAGVAQLWPSLRPVAALAALAIVGTQLVNFEAINDGWRIVHDEGYTRQRMEKARLARDRRIPISPDPHELTRAEVSAIWTAWKQGRLDRYLRDTPVSSSAVWEVVELQELDRAR